MAYSTNPNLPKVRQQAVKLVYQGWGIRQTARYMGVQPGTVSKWLTKDHWYGRIPLATLSSRPEHSPQALPEKIIKAIVELSVSKLLVRIHPVYHPRITHIGLYRAALPA